MKEREDKADLKDKSDQDYDPHKSVLTWKNVLETIVIMWIPVIVLVLILKLAGC